MDKRLMTSTAQSPSIIYVSSLDHDFNANIAISENNKLAPTFSFIYILSFR